MWENYPIVVPPVVSSDLNFCRIIDVSYILVVNIFVLTKILWLNYYICLLLQFSVDPGSLSFNLKISHNLIIGNVPLRSSFANLQHRGVVSVAQERYGNPPVTVHPNHMIPGVDAYPDLRK